ncbi:MAG: hypothetical protein HQK75_06695 [Candidatus Magnetomorum sp.]|nr:hypothetical protein [Candidatus Magnetomorum sp.]
MKILRFSLVGVIAFFCVGLLSNASSEMHQINDQYLSNINAQNAVYSVSNNGSNGAVDFFNSLEDAYNLKISDDVKNSETISDAFVFLNQFSSELNNNRHPFAPRFSLLKGDDRTGIDMQLGGLKLHFQAIDINGTVSLQPN